MYGPNDYRAYVENLDESVYHYGVKGQKKGKRRYQNPDGSLTEEGKRHYGRIGLGIAAGAAAGIGGYMLAKKMRMNRMNRLRRGSVAFGQNTVNINRTTFNPSSANKKGYFYRQTYRGGAGLGSNAGFSANKGSFNKKVSLKHPNRHAEAAQVKRSTFTPQGNNKGTFYTQSMINKPRQYAEAEQIKRSTFTPQGTKGSYKKVSLKNPKRDIEAGRRRILKKFVNDNRQDYSSILRDLEPGRRMIRKKMNSDNDLTSYRNMLRIARGRGKINRKFKR